ncbi:MAG: hypothetical protein KME03_19395 [Aphanocapsa lilacina HA4352-LM1]|nr:hypothetical protein [Aphanocapsa lilacina HA4352-LM1]
MKLEMLPGQDLQRQGPPASVGRILSSWWERAEDYQKLVYTIAGALFVIGLLHGAIWLVVGGGWADNVSWRKPTLFLTACGITATTFAWSMNYLKVDRQTGWQLAIGVIVPATFVSSMVALQQWRGTRSHFNFFESPLDAVIAASMVVMIQLLLPTAFIFSRLTFTALRPVPKDLALALRAGILMVNISFFIGFVTIMNAVTNGLLFTLQNPSVIGTAGTMKVPHGVALHGLQIFLALVAVLYFSRWSEASRLAVLRLAVAGYGLLVGVAVFQTLSGHAPLDLSFVVSAAVGTGLVLLAAACTLALWARIAAPRQSA